VAISPNAEIIVVRSPDPREARRRCALISIAEGLQLVSEGLLSLAEAQGEVEGPGDAGTDRPRRRAWRSPQKPKAPTAEELATVTEISARKAELALRKRGLV
jgi:hypothetical protein